MNFEFVNASNGDDWDILWSFDYPWREKFVNNSLFAPFVKNPLKPHQKMNHFPGIFAITSKNYMSYLNTDENFILPTFIMPKNEEKLKIKKIFLYKISMHQHTISCKKNYNFKKNMLSVFFCTHICKFF